MTSERFEPATSKLSIKQLKSIHLLVCATLTWFKAVNPQTTNVDVEDKSKPPYDIPQNKLLGKLQILNRRASLSKVFICYLTNFVITI